MKKFFTIIVTLLVVNSVSAQYDFEVDGIYYNIIDGGVEVANTHHYDYTGDITIPSTVTYNTQTYSVISIEDWAFGKSYITSITIPNSITTIGEYAFFECQELRSITIPQGVTTIGESAFEDCRWLRTISIPNSIISIGEKAFYDTYPKSITNESNVAIQWYGFTLNDLSYKIIGKDSVLVEHAFLDSEFAGEVTIPQIVEFYGKIYTVYGINSYAFQDLSGLTSVSIPNRITSIGEGAFRGCTGLTSITLPNSINSINAFVFAECTNLISITCLAEIPPIISDQACNCIGTPGDSWYEECYKECYRNPFETGGRNAVTVYVPSDAVTLYKIASDWRNSPVEIQPIPAENVTISKDEVDVKVGKATADFYMPINASADSYTLTIKNNGVTFCTLTFNAQGQLANIDFSTTKSYELKADVSAFKFTVTGLSEATDYGYSFKALASNKSVLKEYTGSFTTKNADGTGGSSSGGEGTLAIDNVSANNAVTIANNQILVNGEAPAFVVTISGQKIANQNLKSGVYFVNVEGVTVKVVK